MSEIIRVSWLTSPSTFVERQQVFARINASISAVQQGIDLPSSANVVELPFDTDDTISVFIRTIGDNGSVADSPYTPDFQVTNLESVLAAGTPTLEWVRHQA